MVKPKSNDPLCGAKIIFIKMKPLILISLFLLCSLVVKAQLNKSRGEVMQIMANDSKFTFDKSGRSNYGVEYLSYSIPMTTSPGGVVTATSKMFCFQKDTCVLIKTIRSNNQLNDIIKDLNKRFDSMGNNIWYDVKEKVKYEIVLTENYSVFTVEETPLQN
jgi:hypothetical protein